MKNQTTNHHQGANALSRWLRKTDQNRGVAGHRHERRKVREALRHPYAAFTYDEE